MRHFYCVFHSSPLWCQGKCQLQSTSIASNKINSTNLVRLRFRCSLGLQRSSLYILLWDSMGSSELLLAVLVLSSSNITKSLDILFIYIHWYWYWFIYIYIEIDREREREIRQWCTGLSKAYRCSTALSSARSARTVPSLLPPWLRIGPWIFSFGLAQWKQNRQGSRGKQYKQICCFWRPETWYSITIDPSRQENSCQIPGHQKNPCSKTVILRIRCCRKQWPWPGPISIRFRRNWTMLLEKTQILSWKKKNKKKHYFQAEYWPYWNSKWQMDTNGVATLSQQKKHTNMRNLKLIWSLGGRSSFRRRQCWIFLTAKVGKGQWEIRCRHVKNMRIQRFDRRYHENKCAIQEWEHIYTAHTKHPETSKSRNMSQQTLVKAAECKMQVG